MVEAPLAADLLTDQACTPSCLLAFNDASSCTCRCGGYWHGSLTLAPVWPQSEDAEQSLPPSSEYVLASLTRTAPATPQAARSWAQLARHALAGRRG